MSEHSVSVAGIVLAAGASSRMGRNKLLLEVEGEPLVRRSVRTALEAALSPVLVVVGHEAPAVTKVLSNLPCEFVPNVEYQSGINGSVRRGIARVPEDRAAAVVMLADMPYVTAAMLSEMLATYREVRSPLVLSLYGDVQAPPTLYDRSLFPEFVDGEGEGCGKRIVKRHRGEAEVLRWPAAALTDLDRPDDYEGLGTERVAT